MSFRSYLAIFSRTIDEVNPLDNIYIYISFFPLPPRLNPDISSITRDISYSRKTWQIVIQDRLPHAEPGGVLLSSVLISTLSREGCGENCKLPVILPIYRFSRFFFCFFFFSQMTKNLKLLVSIFIYKKNYFLPPFQ